MSRVFSRYVHRATLGLPRQERLEAAAELRTHLMDRAARLEAEGFSREEAEHLAVKGMGDVGVTNRQLLGHVFTNQVAWVVLAALVLGGGGWWVWQNVPLPMWGQATWRWDNELTVPDLTRLMEDDSAPRSPYHAGDLSLPARTAWFYITVIPRRGAGAGVLSIRNLQYRNGSASPHPALNSRIQARLLLSAEPWAAQTCALRNGQPQMQIYAALHTHHQDLGSDMTGNSSCTGIVLPAPQNLAGGYSTFWKRDLWHEQTVPLNQWTVLAAYIVDLGEKEAGGRTGFTRQPDNAHDYLLAVMPADRPMHRSSGGFEALKHAGLTSHLDGSNWAESAFGLPRPTLHEP
ncbi:permease prefix domain 1-containing protein [Deinococcus terrestris]|uniref:permease prefix domain 1-containing protein n=1 Tax=Deinococcus terrestris TaxID=2651870 RepID=UPI00188405CC|nr:permease prefix domain 1-containing protein [Deinococcus terrestris]